MMRTHTQQKKLFARPLILLATLLLVPVFGLGATVTVGNSPYAVAVNPVTNKIYVLNRGSDSVTVIDGVSNTTMTIPVSGPSAADRSPRRTDPACAALLAPTTSADGDRPLC